jgi:thiosulfate reductase cytochrome b subunit
MVLTGRSFFPHLISAPFRDGLHEAFAFAIVACLLAAVASLMRGGHYHHAEEPSMAAEDPAQTGREEVRIRVGSRQSTSSKEEQHAS